MTAAEYLALITSEHACKQKFEATVSAGVSPFDKLQVVMLGMPGDFDIDTATGKQLDTLGIWIGIPRRIPVPLVGVYFAWDDSAVGWGSGVWQGPFDPDSGLVDLSDDSYRFLLNAKIAANNWDGTIPAAYAIWESIFSDESFLIITDNQDMSMSIGIAGRTLSIVDHALLVNGLLPIKPSGVRVSQYNVAPAAGALFSWDTAENSALAGWGTGQWAIELNPA